MKPSERELRKLEIVGLLKERGPLWVNDIADLLGLENEISSILIDMRREGRVRLLWVRARTGILAFYTPLETKRETMSAYKSKLPHLVWKSRCWHRSHRLHLPCYRRVYRGVFCRMHQFCSTEGCPLM